GRPPEVEIVRVLPTAILVYRTITRFLFITIQNRVLERSCEEDTVIILPHSSFSSADNPEPQYSFSQSVELPAVEFPRRFQLHFNQSTSSRGLEYQLASAEFFLHRRQWRDHSPVQRLGWCGCPLARSAQRYCKLERLTPRTVDRQPSRVHCSRRSDGRPLVQLPRRWLLYSRPLRPVHLRSHQSGLWATRRWSRRVAISGLSA